MSVLPTGLLEDPTQRRRSYGRGLGLGRCLPPPRCDALVHAGLGSSARGRLVRARTERGNAKSNPLQLAPAYARYRLLPCMGVRRANLRKWAGDRGGEPGPGARIWNKARHEVVAGTEGTNRLAASQTPRTTASLQAPGVDRGGPGRPLSSLH